MFGLARGKMWPEKELMPDPGPKPKRGRRTALPGPEQAPAERAEPHELQGPEALQPSAPARR